MGHRDLDEPLGLRLDDEVFSPARQNEYENFGSGLRADPAQVPWGSRGDLLGALDLARVEPQGAVDPGQVAPGLAVRGDAAVAVDGPFAGVVGRQHVG